MTSGEMLTGKCLQNSNVNTTEPGSLRYAVGQNVATTWSYNRMPPNKDKPEFERHVEGWFDEVHKYNWRARDIDPFKFRMDTGHYTQVKSWKNSQI